MLAAFMVILSYLLGCIPSAYIAGRIGKAVDIRRLGDGNMGAGNVYREISPFAGVAVLLADATKGALAVLAAKLASVSDPVVIICGIAAIAGHNWPLPLGFRGGRGVSTTIGVLIVLLPNEMAIMLVVAAVTLLASRNVNLTCGLMFAPLPLVSWILGAPVALIALSGGLPSLVGFTHYISSRRALQKTEGLVASAHQNGK